MSRSSSAAQRSAAQGGRGGGGARKPPPAALAITQELRLLTPDGDLDPLSLHAMPPTVLSAALDAIKIPLAEQGPFFQWLALTKHERCGTNEEALIRHFSEAEKRRIDRWRDPLAKHASERASIAGQGLEVIRAEYGQAVKDGRLNAEESFFLAHLLFSDDEDRKYMAAVCLRHGWPERALNHNFLEALRRDGGRDGAFLETYGDKIVCCAFPIHPAGEKFDSLTQALLNGTQVAGGGPRASGGFAPSGTGFGAVVGGPRAAKESKEGGVHGGGYVPVGTLPNGQQAADVTRLERANASLVKQVAALERRTIELGGAVYRPGDRDRGRGGAERSSAPRGRGGRGSTAGGEEEADVNPSLGFRAVKSS